MRLKRVVRGLILGAALLLVASVVMAIMVPGSTKKGATPFGALSAMTFPASDSPKILPPKSVDIGLKARIVAAATPTPATPQTSPAVAPANAVAAATPIATPSAPSPIMPLPPAAPPAPVTPSPEQQPVAAASQPVVPSATAAEAPPPQSDVAVAEPTAPTETGAETPAPANGVLDINTASAEMLNHLPGVGRIGKTVVSHRPYRSIQDLVSRRVLRASDFEKIRDKITAQ